MTFLYYYTITDRFPKKSQIMYYNKMVREYTYNYHFFISNAQRFVYINLFAGVWVFEK